MSVIVIFILFLLAMTAALILGISLIFPLLAGFFLFSGKALSMGYSIKNIGKMIAPGIKDALIVAKILVLVGCLTGLWRSCGTIACFIVTGIGIIPPKLFVVCAFLLSSIMSYALGTSFGVTATCGTILIAIAKAGGADTVLTCGAILSGVYVGDRGSPASSAANLVAVLTGTDISDNVRKMLRSTLVPFCICVLVYGALSVHAPLGKEDVSLLTGIEEGFDTGWICLLPAALMIILPLCRVRITVSMLITIVVSVLIDVFYQHTPIADSMLAMLRGYIPENAALSETLSGGGIVSMLEVDVILLISGGFGGIFRETGMLVPLTGKISQISEKRGRFPVIAILSVICCAIFCNQVISTMMLSQISADLYGDSEEEKDAKMLDIESSVIVIAGLVPWCIACSVPLAMLGADIRSLPFAFFLWLVPIWRLIQYGRTEKIK